MLAVPKLHEPDPLPPARGQLPIRDGDGDARADERGFDVGLREKGGRMSAERFLRDCRIRGTCFFPRKRVFLPSQNVFPGLPSSIARPSHTIALTHPRTHRHIIRPLRIMPIHPLPLPPPRLLRHDPLQRIAHILPHILIPILIQTQRAARVLHEQVHQADFELFDLRQRVHDLGGDEVGAAAAGGEGELFLEEGHCWWEGGGGWEAGAGTRAMVVVGGVGRGGGGGGEEGEEGQFEEGDEDVGEEGEDEEGEKEQTRGERGAVRHGLVVENLFSSTLRKGSTSWRVRGLRS